MLYSPHSPSQMAARLSQSSTPDRTVLSTSVDRPTTSPFQHLQPKLASTPRPSPNSLRRRLLCPITSRAMISLLDRHATCLLPIGVSILFALVALPSRHRQSLTSDRIFIILSVHLIWCLNPIRHSTRRQSSGSRRCLDWVRGKCKNLTFHASASPLISFVTWLA